MKKWNETQFAWFFHNNGGVETNILSKSKMSLYCEALDITSKRHPSNQVYLRLFFTPAAGIYVATGNEEWKEIMKRLDKVIGRKATMRWEDSMTAFTALFYLKPGEEFCDAAAIIGKNIFAEFAIVRGEDERAATFVIKQTTWVHAHIAPYTERVWMLLSEFLKLKHGLEF